MNKEWCIERECLIGKNGSRGEFQSRETRARFACGEPAAPFLSAWRNGLMEDVIVQARLAVLEHSMMQWLPVARWFCNYCSAATFLCG
jgi:hypothetical protein